MAADVRGELESAKHGAQGVETGVVASQCIAVLMIDGVRVACLCEYGEKIVCMGGPAVHDCLHHGFDLYVDALFGLMAYIYELTVCDVGLAHVCQIDEGETACAEAEYEDVTCKFEMLLHVVQTPARAVATG